MIYAASGVSNGDVGTVEGDADALKSGVACHGGDNRLGVKRLAVWQYESEVADVLNPLVRKGFAS